MAHLISVCMDCGTEYGRKDSEGQPAGVSHGLCSPCGDVREQAATARERLEHAGAVVAMLGLFLGAFSPWWLP